VSEVVTIPDEVLNNEDLMEAFLKEADPKLEPGSVRNKTVTHAGDAEQPFPQAVTSVTSAGYVELWNTKTGERSLSNRNMLPIQLRKKHPDGTRVYTLVDPKIPQKRGSHTCLLHPDRPEREMFDGMGFPVCTKTNIPNEWQVEYGHMAAKHPKQWEAIQKMREEAKTARREKMELAILEMAARGAAMKDEAPQAT
jgi:hypothetical protein